MDGTRTEKWKKIRRQSARRWRQMGHKLRKEREGDNKGGKWKR